MHKKGERWRAGRPLHYSIFLGGLQIPFRSILLCLFPLFSLSSEKSESSSKDGSFRSGMRSEQFHCSQQRGLCQFCQAWHAFFPSCHPFMAQGINVVVMINSKCTNDVLLYQLMAPYTRCTVKCVLGTFPTPPQLSAMPPPLSLSTQTDVQFTNNGWVSTTSGLYN